MILLSINNYSNNFHLRCSMLSIQKEKHTFIYFISTQIENVFCSISITRFSTHTTHEVF